MLATHTRQHMASWQWRLLTNSTWDPKDEPSEPWPSRHFPEESRTCGKSVVAPRKNARNILKKCKRIVVGCIWVTTSLKTTSNSNYIDVLLWFSTNFYSSCMMLPNASASSAGDTLNGWFQLHPREHPSLSLQLRQPQHGNMPLRTWPLPAWDILSLFVRLHHPIWTLAFLSHSKIYTVYIYVYLYTPYYALLLIFLSSLMQGCGYVWCKSQHKTTGIYIDR